MKKFMRRNKYYLIGFILLSSIIYFFSLPDPLFHDPYSTILVDKDGQLLSASISEDGQWRFPMQSDYAVPEKFVEALTEFEDKRFFYHPGVDPIAFSRAIKQNFNARKVVSGGSTISMQVIRLSRKGKGRTFFEKIVEIVLASRLELKYSKKEILQLYAAHAPFGGNVVGLEAACWRYFGRSPEELSWAEASLLAVLPNAPSLLHPGKNREQLIEKRNSLLDRLSNNNLLDSLSASLAKVEPIPDQPHPLPQYARHLLVRASNDGLAQTRITSTVDIELQKRVEQLVEDHYKRLAANHIGNAAALVLDVETGNALAYVGNVNRSSDRTKGTEVDVITAPRSTGSILKPFLFAALLDEGQLLPKSLQPDIPTIIDGFSPKNFSHEYDGAVGADQALIRSLNIPAVHMLRKYRYEKFHSLLKNIGMTSLQFQPDHYGLSLILGGSEGTLWDITGMYGSMARTLNHYFDYAGSLRYSKSDFHLPTYTLVEEDAPEVENSSWLSAAAVYQTFEALKEVYRPGEETGWQYFDNSKTVAWKTGTSFGFRDGWAVGVTSKYVVGVWVGNADGEGRPGLTGTETAAPLMFSIFALLPNHKWFDKPNPEMIEIEVCVKSGYRKSEFCPEVEVMAVVRKGLESPSCPYHKPIHLTEDLVYRVNSSCESVDKLITMPWFILPPIQEYYYRSKNLSYKPVPPFRNDCLLAESITPMDIIYPKEGSKIYIPKGLNGDSQHIVFESVHRNPEINVYWHVDGEYVGVSRKNHHFGLNMQKGKHLLTLVDEDGAEISRNFEIISN